MIMIVTLGTAKFVGLVILTLLAGLVAGAQFTSHEERALDYNLEDVELDELKHIESIVSDKGKAVIAKLKAAATRLKRAEEAIKQAL